MHRFPLTLAIIATVVGAVPATAATTNDRSIGTFHSPSGNVRCTINAQRVVCTTIQKPRIAARIRAGKKAESRPPLTIPPGSNLPYGQTTTVGRFSCSSSTSGVRCRDRQTGHAFLISRQGAKLLPAAVTAKKPVTKTSGGSSGTDRRLSSCAAVRSAGLGPYVRGVDPEYYWYRDADHDGTVCE